MPERSLRMPLDFDVHFCTEDPTCGDDTTFAQLYAKWPPSSAEGGRTLCFSAVGREPEGERSALAEFAFHSQTTLVSVGSPVGDGQA